MEAVEQTNTPFELSSSLRDSFAVVQLCCKERRGGGRKCRNFLKILGVLLLTSSNTILNEGAAEPSAKLVRKAIRKPMAGAFFDMYSSLTRPLLANLVRKAQRAGDRLMNPDFYILGRAWFNALIVDLSGFILRRSTSAGLEGEDSESDTSARDEGTRNDSSTRWLAAPSLLKEDGYQEAAEVAPLLRPSKGSGANKSHTEVDQRGGSLPDDDSLSDGSVLHLHKKAIKLWEVAFEDIFMEVAKKLLPRKVLQLIKTMDENQYSVLRPTLEHALYKTLSEFYTTLMSTGTSEAILPDYHVAVSSDTCPFSLYTSYTFMALIAAGRSGVDALFLADEMMQHYKNEPYISPECKIFTESMAETLILDSMTLHEMVERSAGVAQRSFYTLRDLVILQKAALLGLAVKSADNGAQVRHEELGGE